MKDNMNNQQGRSQGNSTGNKINNPQAGNLNTKQPLNPKGPTAHGQTSGLKQPWNQQNKDRR